MVLTSSAKTLLILVSCVVLLSNNIAHGATVSIDSPANDRLTLNGKADLRGRGEPEGGVVAVTVNGSTVKTTVANGRWAVQGLSLVTGVNVIEVRLMDAVARVMVIRGTGIARQPTQRVTFHWNAGVDEDLKAIARDTLDKQLTPAELNAFVAAVKQRVQDLFFAHYKGVADVQLAAASGPAVHTIDLLSASTSFYGESPYDCGNTKPRETSNVYVGTYRTMMVSEFGNWGPMRRSDSVDLRKEDVSQALSRTATHEFAHSLGLVGEPNGLCGWMDGCDGGHNCDLLDAKYPSLADRFDNGWHFMDPGNKTQNNARLAEPDSDKRAADRQPARFEGFGFSYLQIVHPTP